MPPPHSVNDKHMEGRTTTGGGGSSGSSTSSNATTTISNSRRQHQQQHPEGMVPAYNLMTQSFDTISTDGGGINGILDTVAVGRDFVMMNNTAITVGEGGRNRIGDNSTKSKMSRRHDGHNGNMDDQVNNDDDDQKPLP